MSWNEVCPASSPSRRAVTLASMVLRLACLAIPSLSAAAPVMVIDHSEWIGSRCENPLSLSAERSVDLTIPPGASAWVRLRFTESQRYLVRAGASEDLTVSLSSSCSGKAQPLGLSTGHASEAAIVAKAGDAVTVRVANTTTAVSKTTLSVTGATFISGRVTSEESGLPLQRVEVRAFAVNGSRLAGSAYTDANGEYLMSINWLGTDGGYRLRTGEDFYVRYLHEAWPGSACTEAPAYNLYSCDSPATLNVNPGAHLPFIDFALGTGAILEGRVRDTVTGLPVQHAWLEVYAGTSQQRLRQEPADSAGRYRIVGLKPGPIRVRVWSPDHEGELHPDIPCPYEGCSLAPGAIVEVSASQPTTVDFSLNPTSYIDVALTLEGAPVGYESLYIVVGADGIARYFQYVGSRLGPLSPGTYYVSAQAPGGFDRVYDGVECDPYCSVEQITQVGTPIVISQPGDSPRIAIDLRRLPLLSGRVVNTRGQAVAGAIVLVAGSSRPGRSARTDVDGNYVVRGIFPGEYKVFVDATDYVDQLYPAVDCETEGSVGACAGASTVTFGRTTGDRSADFVLRDAPRVSGNITVLGRPATGLYSGWERSLRLIKQDGTEVQGTMARIDTVESTYELTDYPPGSYYVRASISGGYDQLADGKNCIFVPPLQFECSLEGAHLYSLGAEDVQVDFDLTPLGQRVVVQDRNGTPLTGIALDLWNSDGYSLGTTSTGSEGWVVLPGFEGAVTLSTDNLSGFLDQVYRDITCPRRTSAYRGGCSLDGSLPLTLQPSAMATAPIVFTLDPDPTVFVGDFESN